MEPFPIPLADLFSVVSIAHVLSFKEVEVVMVR